MARPKKSTEVWYAKVAELMVRDQISFRNAISELEIPLANDEAVRIERNKVFKKTLLAEQNRFYAELADDPTRNKASLIGEMLFCARKLMLEHSFDKALEGFFKVARTEGIIGPETNVNVFHDLSAKDISEAKIRLAELEKEEKSQQVM